MIGSLTILTLAAFVIVLLTTQKRVDYSSSDRDWRDVYSKKNQDQSKK